MKRNEFIRLKEKTKKYYDKAQKSEEELFKYLEESYPNIDLEDVPSSAENAGNIKEAIMCYCQYDEYTAEKIYEELEKLN